MWGVLIVFTLIAIIWGVPLLLLRGKNLGAYDIPLEASMSSDPPSEANAEVHAWAAGMSTSMARGTPKQRLSSLRKYMDDLGEEAVFEGNIIPVNTASVKGEWLLSPGADISRRLLYIHGGGWMIGSPRSHRSITCKYATMTGCAVFALDYRLLPEHKRIAGIQDCRAAYQWILDNGPEGSAPASDLYVSGDSAGGNLSLSVVAWARDQGLRLPNAVVALAPATDATFCSPSFVNNSRTDPMLGPVFSLVPRLPLFLRFWIAWIFNRIHPCDPEISPAMGDLSELPAILIHASESEMLLDDSRRYVNKARESGSPVTLQSWPNMVHVWHIFEHKLPEARHAFEEIGKFIERYSYSNTVCCPAD
jgi:monoterpene epsilon-lactone hydrolase